MSESQGIEQIAARKRLLVAQSDELRRDPQKGAKLFRSGLLRGGLRNDTETAASGLQWNRDAQLIQ